MSTSRANQAPPAPQPLALLSPFGWLRLLYQVLYHPQALRDALAPPASDDPAAASPPVAGWTLAQRLLVVQALLIALALPLVAALVLTRLGVVLNPWTMGLSLLVGVLFGALFGAAVHPSVGLGVAVVSGSLLGLAGGALIPLAAAPGSRIRLILLLGLAAGIWLGLVLNLMYAVPSGLAEGWPGSAVGLLSLFATLSLLAAGLLGLLDAVPLLTARSGGGSLAAALRLIGRNLVLAALGDLALAGGFGLALLRPDSWALGLISLARYLGGHRLPAHVTPIPLPYLARIVRDTLLTERTAGLRRADELLRDSLQFAPVVTGLNQALAELPRPLLLSTLLALAEAPYDLDLLYYLSAPLENALHAQVAWSLYPLPAGVRAQLARPWDSSLRHDTPAHAVAAGLWRLYQGALHDAADDFASARRFLPQADELYRLARALLAAQGSTTIHSIALLADQGDFANAEEGLPPVGTRLCPQAWRCLGHLQRLTLEAAMIEASISRLTRSQALSRALAELTTALDRVEQVPPPFRQILREIAGRWQTALLNISSHVAEPPDRPPVANPYNVGSPVTGRNFFGRQAILRRLTELWSGSQVPPLVLLYGQRRVGKTSILHNLQRHLGPTAHVGYVNLSLIGDLPRGVGDILLVLADSVSESLRQDGYTPPMLDAAAVAEQPYRALETFLRGVRQALGDDLLILALDEFEQLETWIRQGQVPEDFFRALRGYAQTDPRISFVFAGLPRLREVAARYFEPHLAVVPIKVGFLGHEEASRLLANPSPSFPLELEPAAVERVWDLTAGQPYLTQLVGHCLVSRHNTEAARRGRRPSAPITRQDVEAVAEDAELYWMGRYYFASVWQQAAQPPEGQQALLRALARSEAGCTAEELAAILPDGAELKEALHALARYDLAVRVDDRWRCSVELLRRWLARGGV